jgi:putative endonuclease
MWFVYVLICSDGSFYTGITNNMEKRFVEHQKGKGGAYTRSHKPVKMVYREKQTDKSTALKREAEIKGWTRKKKMKNLKIRAGWAGRKGSRQPG